MKKYRIWVQVDLCGEIEADSEESARDKAHDLFDASWDETDWQIVQVEEIEDE